MFWQQTALHGAVLATVYGALRFLPSAPWLQEIAVVLLALLITAFSVDALRLLLPRKIIEERTDKAIFITGCDTGFGHSLAIRLDKLGFHVFAGCLFPDGEGAQRLQTECSSQLTVIGCDVTNQEQVDAAVVRVGALLKDAHLHAVVNNAGVFTIAEVEWCPLSMYRRLFEINCLGAIRVTKAFLPLVRAHGTGGRVVIVASLAGRYTIPGLSAYSASKHATISFADGLRREMHKFNISVHTVEPSTYRTPILDESVLNNTVNNDWNAAAADVRESYGEQYRDEFKVKFLDELKNARPSNRIYEVVDDILDAAVGTEPRHRYVPSAVVTLRSQMLQNLPTPMVDSLLEKRACPPTPPASVIRQRQRRLKNPYTSPRPTQRPAPMKRFHSVPAFEKAPPSPAINGQSSGSFTASGSHIEQNEPEPNRKASLAEEDEDNAKDELQAE